MDLSSVERRILDTPYWAAQRQGEVTALFRDLDLRDKRVLVVGAGRTALTRDEISGQLSKVTNIDREFLPGLDLIACATQLPFLDESFEMVLFLRVLHHIDDFRKAWRSHSSFRANKIFCSGFKEVKNLPISPRKHCFPQ